MFKKKVKEHVIYSLKKSFSYLHCFLKQEFEVYYALYMHIYLE